MNTPSHTVFTHEIFISQGMGNADVVVRVTEDEANKALQAWDNKKAVPVPMKEDGERRVEYIASVRISRIRPRSKPKPIPPKLPEPEFSEEQKQQQKRKLQEIGAKYGITQKPKEKTPPKRKYNSKPSLEFQAEMKKTLEDYPQLQSLTTRKKHGR